MTATRERIASYVAAEPGVHFNAIVRSLDLAPGQVQYHLRRLRGDRIERERVRGRTHYYPEGYDAFERRALALLGRETTRDVVAALLSAGPSRPEALRERVGIARSTLEWHLEGLAAADIVTKERDDDGRVTVVLARPEATGALLASVEPSLPERLADRYERLLDGLLEE